MTLSLPSYRFQAVPVVVNPTVDGAVLDEITSVAATRVALSPLAPSTGTGIVLQLLDPLCVNLQ
jgi:hypothetical protein